MNKRTIKEIEEEMNDHVSQGNIGKVMDLVDEHGNTIDKMFYTVIDGDLERIHEMENLGATTSFSRRAGKACPIASEPTRT